MKLKIRNFLSKKFTINNFLILFLIINPVFDLKIFYNSISTLIRVICIVFFFTYYFFTSKNNKKYLLSIYPLVIFIYFICHHINALNFTSLVPGNFNYSISKETLYFIKMLCPYMLIYSLYKSKLSIKDLFKIINCLVLVISLLIIITNVLGISYCNYGSGKIKANFFSWFNSNSSYDYTVLLSKGPFEYGNQLSAILLMFLPFTIYQYFKDKQPINIFIIFSQLFALTLLGTRVAILGVFLVIIYFMILCLIFENHKLKRLFKTFIPIAILFILFISILPFNPIFSRLKEHKEIVQTVTNIDNTKITQEDLNSEELNSEIPIENISKFDFVKNTYTENKINENFILYRYPYTCDVDFWYEIISNNNPNKTNTRFLEEAMVKRVVTINNNKLDKILGITYTRVQNIFNIEKDFVMQYYSLGLLGLIIIFIPYFAILIHYFVKIFINKFKGIDLLQILSFVTICMIFCISYFSGNLLNSLSFTIYFTLLYKLLLVRE